MRIKMLATTSGSYDGIHIHTYDKDQEFEVGDNYMPEDLAKAFLASGAAKDVNAPSKKAPGPSETKDEKPDEKKK